MENEDTGNSGDIPELCQEKGCKPVAGGSPAIGWWCERHLGERGYGVAVVGKYAGQESGAWIPCQERMPEPEDFEPWERVLVLVEGFPDELSPAIAYLDTGGMADRWRADGGWLLEDGAVTHWMRIPAYEQGG